MIQKYSSKDTSINVVNKVYKKYDFLPSSKILDYGGGRYDTNKEFLHRQGKNIDLLVYDKYNRDDSHNKFVLEYCEKNKIDYIVCSNVLNVIYEEDVILNIIEHIYELSDNDTIILFVIYEGDRSGIGKETTKGYQRNQLTNEYYKYISKFFNIDREKNKILVCKKKVV